MKLLIATENKDKLKTFLRILGPIDGLELTPLDDSYVQPEETGSTFEENSYLKALDAAKTFNMHALADDSGLVVPTLQGAPGIFSARYGGEHGNYAKNRQKLLADMKPFTGDMRYAYFQACISIASPTKIIKSVNGKCEGHLIDEERGKDGFGYDPIFVHKGWTKTFAEVDGETKSQVSARGKALDKIKEFISNEILH